MAWTRDWIGIPVYDVRHLDAKLSHAALKRLLAAIAFVAIVAMFWVPPLAQPSAYHHFADQRSCAGIPNCANVLSNLGFLLVGGWGLLILARRQPPIRFAVPLERTAYCILMIGFVLTGVGSAFYHWAPSNDRLVWDRLPMTVAFMSLTAAIFGERVDARCYRWLWPLILTGIASVEYWHWTELRQRGDLRPYLLVQFLPLLLILILLMVGRPRYSGSSFLLGALVFYSLAKAAETFDRQIYSLTGRLSGHALKHLLAAAGCAMLVFMISRRKPIASAV